MAVDLEKALSQIDSIFVIYSAPNLFKESNPGWPTADFLVEYVNKSWAQLAKLFILTPENKFLI